MQKKELYQVAVESKNIKIDLGNPRDWNAEYQKILEQPAFGVEQKLKEYHAIASLAQDFEYTGTFQKCTFLTPAKTDTVF